MNCICSTVIELPGIFSPIPLITSGKLYSEDCGYQQVPAKYEPLWLICSLAMFEYVHFSLTTNALMMYKYDTSLVNLVIRYDSMFDFVSSSSWVRSTCFLMTNSISSFIFLGIENLDDV